MCKITKAQVTMVLTYRKTESYLSGQSLSNFIPGVLYNTHPLFTSGKILECSSRDISIVFREGVYTQARGNTCSPNPKVSVWPSSEVVRGWPCETSTILTI